MKSYSTNPRAVTRQAASDDELDLIEVDLDETPRDPIVLVLFGGPGVGKSKLITTAPSAIGFIPTESKSRQTVLTEAKKLNKTIIMPSLNGKEVSLIRTTRPMLLASLPDTCIVIGDAAHKGCTPGALQDEMQKIASTITINGEAPVCCRRHYFRWHVNRVKHYAYLMLEDERIKTIAIDTFGTFVDDVSMANYGITGVIDPKEFGFAPREDMNKEVREFLNNMCQKHLVLTHHASDVWREGKPTSKTKPASGFGKMGHYTTVLGEMVRNDPKNVEGDGWTYKFVVRDCQSNAGIISADGLLFDSTITFTNLAMAVYEDTDESDWED